MYATFGVSMVLLFMLSYPATDYTIHGIKGDIRFSTSMSLVPFVITIFVLGFFMSLGKAAVFKHIPVYYPDHVGSVGGLVGLVGGLGGFVLPIVFGAVSDLTGIWTSCFAWCCSPWSPSRWPGCTWRSGRWSRRPAGSTCAALPQFPEMASTARRPRPSRAPPPATC
jgi:NNP family nitrate/nitrite transporter-like MFS transporter